MDVDELWDALVRRGAILSQGDDGALVVDTPAPLEDLEEPVRVHAAALVARVRKGGMTRQQLDALWQEQRAHLGALAGSIVGAERAGDVLSKAYLELVRSLPTYRDRGRAALVGWLRTVVQTTAMDHERRDPRRREVCLSTIEERGEAGPEDLVLDAQMVQGWMERVDAAGLTLPQRVALVAAIHGVDRGVVQQMLGVSAVYHRQHLFNARTALRRGAPAQETRR